MVKKLVFSVMIFTLLFSGFAPTFSLAHEEDHEDTTPEEHHEQAHEEARMYTTELKNGSKKKVIREYLNTEKAKEWVTNLREDGYKVDSKQAKVFRDKRSGETMATIPVIKDAEAGDYALILASEKGYDLITPDEMQL